MGRFFRWVARLVGRAIRYIARGIGQWVSRTCFGTWRRTLATLFVLGLVLSNYFPKQVVPIFEPVVATGITIFGIRVMLIPFWPMGGGRRRRRRRRD